ncbi:MAG: MarR family winged helix-turn-helix transcriptional regulator [Hyphomonadaceae bacterium]|nr:MarR family winged helix-turn-helix transcriptional regulator [Hyphomonadaceae bacterium]
MDETAKSIGTPMPAFAGAPGVCLCARARAAARRLTAHYDAHLEAHGVTLPQFGLLATIAAAGEAPIAQIAATVALDPSTLSRTLAPLVAAGLVESLTDPSNRRARIVRLTADGRQKVNAAGRAWAKAQNTAAALIDAEAVGAVYRQTKALEGAGRG